MDPLIEMPREIWPKLRDSFQINWPRGVVGFNLLNQQMSVPMNHYVHFKVFCPYGNINYGIVATITVGSSCEIIIELNTCNVEPLQIALIETNVLKWTRETVITFVDSDVLKILNKVYKRLNLKVEQEYGAIKHFYSKDSEMFRDLCTPPGVRIGKLRIDHLDLVNESWPYHDAVSKLKIRGYIEMNLNYALYSNEELLAWLLIDESGAFCHLYCMPDFRRQGYAEFLIKYSTNDLLAEGRDCLVFTDEKNTKSMRLFRKLGYKVIGWGVWHYFQKPCFDEADVK